MKKNGAHPCERLIPGLDQLAYRFARDRHRFATQIGEFPWESGTGQVGLLVRRRNFSGSSVAAVVVVAAAPLLLLARGLFRDKGARRFYSFGVYSFIEQG